VRCELFVEDVFVEHLKLPAKLLDYFLPSNESNINQTLGWAAPLSFLGSVRVIQL